MLSLRSDRLLLYCLFMLVGRFPDLLVLLQVYDKVKPEDGIVDLSKEEAADKRATVSGKRK